MKLVKKYRLLWIPVLALLLTACAGATSDKAEVAQDIPNTAIADNPYLGLRYFAELLRNEKPTLQNNAVTMKELDSAGVMISGSNEEMKEVRLLPEEEYDFGSAKIQRIMINGLGQKGCITGVNIYLDGAEEPVASVVLPPQDKEGVWEQGIKNVNAIVSGQNITGKHKVEFSVWQEPDNREAKATGDLKVLLESVQFVAETIPLINIRIDESKGTIAEMNGDEIHNTKCTGEFDVLISDGYAGDYTDAYSGGTYEMKYIKGRGNSTWTSGQRLPYKIKLRKSADLFGMGSETNWALIANAYDNDLIRNAFTYKIGEELELRYTPQCVSVDVVMNGEYLGNYLLCENIRVGEGRVEIDDLDGEENPENMTGGYLIGGGAWGADADAYIFTTAHGEEFNVNSPCDAQNPGYTDEIDYIVNFMQRIENALYGEPDPVTGVVEDPFALMDLDSAVKYYWIQELSANGDFLVTGSTYCYKERDGKLYWGPLWDFDVAWDEKAMTSDSWKNRIGWFQVMLSNDTFAKAAEDYYKNTLKPILDEMLSEEGYCNTYFEKLEYSAINNHTIWGFRKENFTFERDAPDVRTVFEESHQNFMDSVKHRVQWCADHLDSLKTERIKIVFVAEGEIYDTRTGYVNKEVMLFPEDPQMPGKRFTGWNYNGTDYEGNPSLNVFNQYVPVPEEALEILDGETALVVYASFEDRDESREVKEIRFPQSSYNLSLNSASEENWSYIYLDIYPEDGYVDEIKWSVSDDSICEVYFIGNLIEVCPKKAGTVVITGTLMDGTTYSLPITVM